MLHSVRSRTRAALLTAVLVVAAGCTADSSRGPSATGRGPETAASPSAQPTPRNASEAEPLPADAYDLVATVPLVKDGTRTSLSAVDEDGTLLLVRAEEAAPLELRQPVLALRSPSGEEVTFGVTPRRPHQVIDAALDDRWVVWMEDPHTELSVSSWVLHSYDRRTGAVRELARAPRLGATEPPSVPGYTGPVLAGGRVFWAQVGGRPGALSVDVMGCDPRACEPETVLRGAALPAAAGDSLYAVATERFAGDPEGEPAMTIRRLDTTDGGVDDIRTVQLTESQSPGGLAASATGVLWSVTDSAGADLVTLLDLSTGTDVTVGSAPGGGFGYPVLTERYAAWAESSGTQQVGNLLLDRRTGELRSFGSQGLYGVDGTGELLAWRDYEGRRRPQDPVVQWVARLR